MRLVYPYDVWNYVRLPTIPFEVRSSDLTFDQQERLNIALATLKMANKPNGKRRSIHGLNRVAQHKFPNFEWNIADTEQVAEAWQIAGLDSLIESVRNRNLNNPFARHFGHVRVDLSDFVAHDLGESYPDEIFFVTQRLYHLWYEVKDYSHHWHWYRVIARTKFGRYRFHVVNFEPPNHNEVESLCVAHNQIS